MGAGWINRRVRRGLACPCFVRAYRDKNKFEADHAGQRTRSAKIWAPEETGATGPT